MTHKRANSNFIPVGFHPTGCIRVNLTNWWTSLYHFSTIDTRREYRFDQETFPRGGKHSKTRDSRDGFTWLSRQREDPAFSRE